MSSIKGPTNSPNTTITQDATIPQESTTPRRRIKFTGLMDVQNDDVSNLKIKNSITAGVSNESYKLINNIAQESGITPTSKIEEIKKLEQEYVNEKLSVRTANVEIEPTQTQKNVTLQSAPRTLRSLESNTVNKQVNESNNKNYESERKISNSQNTTRSTQRPVLQRDLGVESNYGEPISIKKLPEIIGNKKISKKETYELNHDGTIFECIENRNIENVDKSRLIFMRNGNIIRSEGLHFSNHVQVKHADGSVRNLEFEKIYVLPRHEFESFIHPVLERLGEQSLKDKNSKDEQTTTNVNNHPSITSQKDIKAVDPIMKKLLETKDELEFQDKNQIRKGSSIRSEKMKLQKETALRKKLSKIDDLANEKNLGSINNFEKLNIDNHMS